jgi:hypothetical protein
VDVDSHLALKREKLAVYHELVGSEHAPRDVLRRYVQSALEGQPEAVWAWQRAFASQLGVSSLLCYVLACGDRSPHKLIFHRQTARILSAELRPTYSSKVRAYVRATCACPE